MTIHFDYNKSQVMQALRYHFVSRPEIRTMIILVNVFALVSLGLYLWGKVTSFAFLTGSLMWLFLMISFWFMLPMLVYKRAETFQHAFSMDFLQDGFSLNHDNGGSRSWKWNSLKYYLETPHFFHFYFDAKSFFLVPKNGFNNSDDQMELRKLLKDGGVKKK